MVNIKATIHQSTDNSATVVFLIQTGRTRLNIVHLAFRPCIKQ